MIAITAQASGTEVAKAMHDDLEEAAHVFPAFAARLQGGDWDDLASFIEDEMVFGDRKAELKRLGELLVKASEA